MTTSQAKTILGIDPGTNYTGYGVLRVEDKGAECVVLGYIELHRIDDTYQKLRHIFDRVGAIIDEYKPDEIALESPFFDKNVQSMLKLGRAQGVAMAAALTRGLPVYEYPPARVKQSIAGHGTASKEQVATLLKAMLKVEYSLKKLDATDGLAVALCHHFTTSSPIPASLPKKRTKSPSWSDFLAKNPERQRR